MSVHDLTEVHLELQQRALLAVIGTQQAADPDGQWPMWDWVQHRAKSSGTEDPRGVLDSLPRIGASGSLGLSYGFTMAVPRILAADTRIALTVAGAWALDEPRCDLGEPFVQVLHHMITLWWNAPRSPNEVTKVTLTSEDLKRALPHLRDRTIRLVPEYFSREPLLHASYSKQQDGSWQMDVPEDVTRYAHATVLGYVGEACRQVNRVRQEVDREFSVGQPALAPQPDAVLHTGASRTALLTWLWHQMHGQASGGPMPHVLGVLSDDDLAVDQGVRFTADEIDRASAYLEQHGLIAGGGRTDHNAGPVLARITAAGEECVENYNGDISAYIRRRGNTGVTFHIATNTGNIAANSTGITQNATSDASGPAQLLAAASLIRELAPALTPDAGEQQKLQAQAGELQAAAEAPALDPIVVRRIADGVLAAIRGLAHAPDVQRLALDVVEQGVQNL